MALHAGQLRLRTAGHGAVTDITAGVHSVVRASGAADAVATVFVTGSTAAITTIEFEPGAVADLREVLDRLIPSAGDYAHNRLNHDGNAHAHLRAAVVGPSESIPVAGGRLLLGTWQQVVLLDFDTRPRDRVVSVHVAW